jgi:membrane-associated phospholipid phosphatase
MTTFFTGFFRVWAGKHFITDVLTAVVAGVLVAGAVAWVHRPKNTV